MQEATFGSLVPFYLLVRTLVKDSMKLAPTLFLPAGPREAFGPSTVRFLEHLPG